MKQRQIKTGVKVKRKTDNSIWVVISRVYNEVMIHPESDYPILIHENVGIYTWEEFKEKYSPPTIQRGRQGGKE